MAVKKRRSDTQTTVPQVAADEQAIMRALLATPRQKGTAVADLKASLQRARRALKQTGTKKAAKKRKRR
jgi:hypothetical protein